MSGSNSVANSNKHTPVDSMYAVLSQNLLGKGKVVSHNVVEFEKEAASSMLYTGGTVKTRLSYKENPSPAGKKYVQCQYTETPRVQPNLLREGENPVSVLSHGFSSKEVKMSKSVIDLLDAAQFET